MSSIREPNCIQNTDILNKSGLFFRINGSKIILEYSSEIQGKQGYIPYTYIFPNSYRGRAG